MEFRKENEELSFVDRMFDGDPSINVIDKDRFSARVEKVFNILYQSLVKSFGPGGAGTFVSVYPKYYNTKDGFTIMKNIAFDKKLDQVICDMVMDICSRLNFTVGDGTTTAVIATNAMYNSYLRRKNEFEKMNILPRDIMKRLEEIKDTILEKMDAASTNIRSDDPDVLAENIRKVVWVSSNGNEEITNMISNLYRELMFPAISVTLSQDGIMKSKIVSGYNIDVTLTDKIYINNDNNTMVLNGANVVIFDHKVTKATYEVLLRPLSIASKNRGKHLICIAPYYDEVALNGVIRSDLLAEYKNTKDVNLVLAVCKRAKGNDKIRLDDLAMLLNTQMITSTEEMNLIEKMQNPDVDSSTVFDFDNRGIEGLGVAYQIDDQHLRVEPYHADSDKKPYNAEFAKEAFRIGYADDATIGLKEATFSGFYYDEAEYHKYMNIAKSELEEIQRKVENNGTFSFDLVAKQERLYALGMKAGVIEVGASSEISQNYLKDMVDDAVKAAASAYDNGIVLGCNVTMSRILKNMVEKSTDELEYILLNILLGGFKDVYRSVLNNIFSDISFGDVQSVDYGTAIQTMKENTPLTDVEFTNPEFYDAIQSVTEVTAHNTLINMSINKNAVIDVGNHGTFTTDIINSAETDKEILKAVIDLLSLLITGNQMVIC